MKTEENGGKGRREGGKVAKKDRRKKGKVKAREGRRRKE